MVGKKTRRFNTTKTSSSRKLESMLSEFSMDSSFCEDDDVTMWRTLPATHFFAGAAAAAAPPGLRKYLKNSDPGSSTITSPRLLKLAR